MVFLIVVGLIVAQASSVGLPHDAMNYEKIEAGARPEVTEAREARRFELRDYAREQLTDQQSKAQALVNIGQGRRAHRGRSAHVREPGGHGDERSPRGDRRRRVREEERGTGRHYVGTDHLGGDEPFFGDDGFKPEFRDARGNAGFQVHHAVAGLVMAYRFGPGVEWYAEFQEPEPEDDRLYDATFSIGNWVSPERLDQLPQRVVDELCDGTCRLLDLDDPYPSCDAPPADQHARELDDALYPTSDAPPADQHAKELDDALYPTSDAPPADQHARELDDALYPTSDAPPADQHARELDDALYPTLDAPPAAQPEPIVTPLASVPEPIVRPLPADPEPIVKPLPPDPEPIVKPFSRGNTAPATGQSSEIDEPAPGGGVLLRLEDAPPTADPEPSEAREPGWGVLLSPEERAQRELAETGGATTRAEAHREPEPPPEPPPTHHSDPPDSHRGPDADTTAPQDDDDSAADGGGPATEAPADGQAAPAPSPETPPSAQDAVPASTSGAEQPAPPAGQDGDATPPTEEPEQSYPMAGEATQTAQDGDYPMPEPDPVAVVEAPPAEPEPQPSEDIPAEEADGG